MPEPTPLKRVAYSPGEFATLFGKSQTWGYRQIYSGKVNAITQHGRILIPAKEVERILESAGIYNGTEQPKREKARVKNLTSEQQSIWQRFVEMRRQSQNFEMSASMAPKQKAPKGTTQKGTSRKDVLGRIANSWKDKPSAS